MGAQHGREAAQDDVALLVAERVVDALEVVEVANQQRRGARAGRGDMAVDVTLEVAPVAQAGEQVVLGEAAHRLELAQGLDRPDRLVGERAQRLQPLAARHHAVGGIVGPDQARDSALAVVKGRRARPTAPRRTAGRRWSGGSRHRASRRFPAASDLARGHQRMVEAPAPDRLVVVHQQLGDRVQDGPVGVLLMGAVELGERLDPRIAGGLALGEVEPERAPGGAERLVERAARRRLAARPGLARAGDPLDRAELARLETRGGRQRVAELEEALGPHRLQHVEVLEQQPLDGDHALSERSAPCGRPPSSSSRARASSCRISLNHSS